MHSRDSEAMDPITPGTKPISANSPRPRKNTANRPFLPVGSQFEKRGVFSPFLVFFCGFSEENIVFVLHYDLKCIFQGN